MIDQAQILEKYDRPDSPFTLVDVRSPYEYQQKHIPGAINIPIDTLEKRLAELPKDSQIITYCNYGNRSSIAEEYLIKQGYIADVLSGGLSSWRGQIENI